MDQKEYFEFGQSLNKIRENLEWRKDKLRKSLVDFKATQKLSYQEYMGRGLLAPFSWHDFIDVSCYTDNSKGPVLDCGYQDIDGNYIKKVSPTLMENGKRRILRTYEFAFELLEEQIQEVNEELEKLENAKNA